MQLRRRCPSVILALCLYGASCVPFKTALLDSTEPLGLLISLGLLSRVVAVAVGANCTYWTLEDGGEWEAHTLPGCSGSASLSGVVNVSNSFLIVGELSGVATGCGIWKSSNGRDWARITCPIAESLGSVAFNPASQTLVAGGYCVLPGGVSFNIIRSTDLGTTWTTQGTVTIGGPCTAGHKMHSMTGYSAGLAGLNSFAGNISRSTDDGVTWGAGAFNPNVTTLTRVFPGTGTRIIATGTASGSPATSSSDDAGTSAWGAATTFGFPSSTGGALLANRSSTFIAVGDNCGLGSSTNNATSWTPASTWSECFALPTHWRALTVTGTGKLYIGGNTVSGGNEMFGFSSVGTGGSWTIRSLRTSNPVQSIAARD